MNNNNNTQELFQKALDAMVTYIKDHKEAFSVAPRCIKTINNSLLVILENNLSLEESTVFSTLSEFIPVAVKFYEQDGLNILEYYFIDIKDPDHSFEYYMQSYINTIKSLIKPKSYLYKGIATVTIEAEVQCGQTEDIDQILNQELKVNKPEITVEGTHIKNYKVDNLKLTTLSKVGIK